ncbi:DUF3089 domain-containing protein [Novosphingobium mangrovi (ex Hu et al. 2023)]|uniref:DUF3089 domain-containing protein n=1 Tax=Novosphingobium mangrovi (ex Hu et al. 2023) TaxID=2930094 RepID=A0ABT0AE89_9SPHN|nr:DUF3089 domain-containing protein [Novosphingobium mangrovi (ex Hu et al. 2023)]MCJ1961517.1 DUF3089 domain-containing protein [Novosphingobium mangrovi (ex Hu et al. 2023)]
MLRGILAFGLGTAGTSGPASVGERGPPPFAESEAPPAPDYANPRAWAAWPGRPSRALQQPGGGLAEGSAHAVDVFYVHPTSFLSRSAWNADAADGPTNRWTDISVLARQASAFNACCRIYAPRYRQASLAAVLDGEEGPRAYDLAYGDVSRAFTHYLETANDGRPFVLMGHSQGALMVRRLLQEHVRGTPLAARMVAAYVVGVAVLEGDFAHDLAGLSPCRGEDDTGCVLSWNTFQAGSDAQSYRARAQGPFLAAHPEGDARLLCNDPVTLAGRARGRGALPGKAGEGNLQALVPGAVTVTCEEGIAMLEVDPALEYAPLPAGNLHYHDVAAFYGDIAADVARRIRAFQGAQS